MGGERDADYLARNREVWDGWSEDYLESGRRGWTRPEATWGIWRRPERELNVLGDVAGLDALDLGCGTGYWSAELVRRGARVVGLDASTRQLANASGFQAEFGLPFPLVQASADAVPLKGERFDLILSEYGGMTWADPYRTVPEAARLLRPGGRLAFLISGMILHLAWPLDADRAGEALANDYFGTRRIVDARDGSTAFQLPYGAWIRLFRANGFEVERLVELQAPAGAAPGRWNWVTPAWAHRWPTEEIWVTRKTGS